MLDKKLEEAKRQDAEKRKKLVVLLVAVVVACAIIIIGLSSFSVSPSDSPGSKEEAFIPVPEQERISQESIDEARDEFKQKLKNYENEIEPLIEVAYLENWNKEAAFEIKDLKDKAISDFSGGHYSQALDLVEKLDARARAVLGKRDHLFADHLQQSQRYYHQGIYDQARMHIDSSLTISPDSEDAKRLKQKIEKLPEILPLLREVDVAKAENNLEKEFLLLSQILQLEPGRVELNKRIAELSDMLKEITFQQNISAAFNEIEKRNARSARDNYKKAQSIFPDRDEIQVLRTQLLALESNLAFVAAIASADKFIRNDDWGKAKAYFEKAAKYDPAHETVIKGLARANRILGLKNAFSQYEKNPYRLANSHYRKKADNDLALSVEAGKSSPSLVLQSERVAKLIYAMNKKKEVFVVSDNKTFVQVRGVGKIGKAVNKTIQLKPGNYTFEGIRDGYKSKLVKVLIPYDQNKINVKVICDEPI